MQVKISGKKFRVGIDLAPASRLKSAPGTATHVLHQVTALMQLDVPWEWAPVAESPRNPLLDICSRWNPSYVEGKSVWRRATFAIGKEWQRRECDLGFATAFFVPWTGIPVVTNFFDAGMFTEEYSKSWKTSGRGWNFRLIKTLGTYSIHRSKLLFTDSHYWKNVLKKRLPKDGNKVIVTPCGVRQPLPRIEKIPDWAMTLIKPFFLYVGVFSDNKNQFRLVEAWRDLQKQYPQLPALVLIGPHSSDYFQQRVAPLIAALPRPEEVVVTGVVSDNDLAWAYQHAHAYLQPSFMEGFGIPIIEAMSYGLPVACSNTTSLPETAGGASLLFTPDDIASIRESVLSLWQDANLRQKYSTLGLARYAQFTWENNARIVVSNIETLLKGLLAR